MSAPDPSAWGVGETYADYRGVTRRPPAETIARILEAMGAESEGPPEAGPEVIVRGERTIFPNAVAVEVEDGGREELRNGRLPPDVPCGYHSLLQKDDSSSKLIVSPGSCWLPPDLWVWGWALQLYSARSATSWGIGDLRDLAGFGRWARGVGAGVTLINPLSAVAPGVPQQASPYFPSSRCFMNPLYLHIEDVPGAVEAGHDLEDAAERGRALNSTRLIDRDAVYDLKMNALEVLWRRFSGSPSFDAYRAERGSSLRAFATYMALAEFHGPDRSRWPTGLQHPGSAQVAGWRRAHETRVTFHEWVQWLLDEQLRVARQEMRLIHDLPVGVDPGGADAWLWQDVFTSGVGVGAPPDELNGAGQGWGLAPLDPWELRAAAYEPFIQTVRAVLRHGAGMRIDHVMGLFRLYWIPGGMPPDAGAYVRYPARELLNILALESQRAGAFIVGEDLGTVEPQVREEMARRNMLSYRVLWFEDEAPQDYPELALATVTNHDLPTIAGVWTGADVEEQSQMRSAPNLGETEVMRDRLQTLLGCSSDARTEDVIAGAYELLANASSRVVLATLEDAVAAPARPNMPGTTTERPNWSIPLPVPIDDLDASELVNRLAQILSARQVKRPIGGAAT